MLSAIVLAAGSSKRMGSINKLLLPYKSKTVLATVAENIIASGIKEIIAVVGYESEKVKEALADLPVLFAENREYEKGMTTSIQKGVLHATGNGYMICLTDMATITAEEYAFMKNNFDEQIQINPKCICLPRYKNEKGNPVIFSAYYREAILQHKDPEGCREIVQSNKEHVYWIEMNDAHILEDLDYPEDYEKLNTIIT